MISNQELTAAEGLDDMAALELQIAPYRAQHTPQGYQRRFLVDPELRLGTEADQTVPYVQTAEGSLEPVNSRAMIVSSVASDVPEDLAFAETWDLADGEVPAGWAVDPEDVFIQRLDLRGSFHRVILNNVDRENESLHAVDGSEIQIIESQGRREAWFLHGTAITFYYATGDLEAREVIREDVSYVHENGKWGRQMVYGERPPWGSFGELVQAFLDAPAPPDPKFGATQQAVVDEFNEYMWTYAIWAIGEPPLIAPFEKGGTTSDTQVPSIRILTDCAARMASFTYNLIN